MTTFSLDRYTDTTGKYWPQFQAQIGTLFMAATRAIGAELGPSAITLDVSVGTAARGAIATAGAVPLVPYATHAGINVVETVVQDDVTGGALYFPSPVIVIDLSETFMSALSAAGSALPTSALNDIMVRELMHTLGVAGYRDPVTGAFAQTAQNGIGQLASLYDVNVAFDGAKPYFVGRSAMAMYGNKVPLVGLGEPGAIYHVDTSAPGLASDLLGQTIDPFASAHGQSALDLSILADLGYRLRDTLVSFDGHVFVPGAGQQTIQGNPDCAGVNTAVMAGARSAYTQSRIDNHVVLTSLAQPVDVDRFVNIDRIKFTDTALAFDPVAMKIDGFYRTAFGHAADPNGLGYWLNDVDHGLALASVATIFKVTPEHASTPDTVTREIAFDTTGNAASVSQLYHAAFNREGDVEGLRYWVGSMTAGATLGQVAASFTNTVEFKAMNPTTTSLVTHLYENALHRAPDAEGLAYWTAAIDSASTSPSHLSGAQVTAIFSALSASVEIVGSASNHGLEYTPLT